MSRVRTRARLAPPALAALLALGACAEASFPSVPAPSTAAVDAALREARLATGGAERAARRAPVAARGEAEGADLLDRALIAARRGDWGAAAEAASALPAGFASPRRARLEALLADRREDWAAADAAYARAVGEDPDPAAVHNNWGMSRMSRGDLAGAVAAFERALALDPDLFAARNNGAIARARLGDYRPPSSALGDAERAVLLNNMGLVALGRGDAATARRLLAEAVATHPRHYAAAADRLAALGDSAL